MHHLCSLSTENLWYEVESSVFGNEFNEIHSVIDRDLEFKIIVNKFWHVRIIDHLFESDSVQNAGKLISWIIN